MFHLQDESFFRGRFGIFLHDGEWVLPDYFTIAFPTFVGIIRLSKPPNVIRIRSYGGGLMMGFLQLNRLLRLCMRVNMRLLGVR